MKAALIISTLYCSLWLFSCSQPKHTNKSDKSEATSSVAKRRFDTSSVLITDTLFGSSDSIQIKRTKCFLHPPAITPLPFGYKVTTENFSKTRELFADLEGGHGDEVNGGRLNKKKKKEIKVYALPRISKVNFIPLYQTDTDRCEDGRPFNQLLKFNKYQYRLPDINKYQCYYFTEFDNSHYYPSKINEKCWWGLIEPFYAGYLILYNPATRVANVIKIYRDTWVDGMGHHTVFYIDRNQTIKLTTFSAPSDDVGDDPDHPGKDNDFWIKINKAGEITVQTR